MSDDKKEENREPNAFEVVAALMATIVAFLFCVMVSTAMALKTLEMWGWM